MTVYHFGIEITDLDAQPKKNTKLANVNNKQASICTTLLHFGHKLKWFHCDLVQQLSQNSFLQRSHCTAFAFSSPLNMDAGAASAALQPVQFLDGVRGHSRSTTENTGGLDMRTPCHTQSSHHLPLPRVDCTKNWTIDSRASPSVTSGFPIRRFPACGSPSS
jgi:hypothetical protein